MDRRPLSRRHGLRFSFLCAWLEDRGYRREEIARLSRNYIRQVIDHARNDEGELTPEWYSGLEDEPSRRDRLRERLRHWNYPEYLLSRRIAELD